MNSTIKQRWVAALRSGEYAQGKSVLRNQDNQYCCLGVLTDLYAKEFNISWKYDDDNNSYALTNEAFGSSTYLIPSVIQWAELSSFNPIVQDFTLSYMNDSGKTFEEIADAIEKYL